MQFPYDVCVVGGCGRVGLPLALAFASVGLRVAIHDLNDASVATVKSGVMPFFEEGAQELLPDVLARGLVVANDLALVGQAENVVVIVGTPIDGHLNPSVSAFSRFAEELCQVMRDGQLLILRSTVYPGTTRRTAALLERGGKRVDVSFCPERVAEGKALQEFRTLPQLVSGIGSAACSRANRLFSLLSDEVIELSPEEAELAKLFTNSWRYIQFATANQFYMIASDHNADFYRIYDAMRWNYPRTQGFPKAGFAAGPCLFKDTMQLVAFNNNNFFLGHAAMLINEGLPNFIVSKLRAAHSLRGKTVGILGMAFKGDIDDSRDSLSYKLRKVLDYEQARVLCTDPFVRDERLLPLEQVMAESEILILGTPHQAYRELTFAPHQEVVDVWNFFSQVHGKSGALP